MTDLLIMRLENSNKYNLIASHIDWLYNSLVRYVGVYDYVSEQVINLIRDAKDLLQVFVSPNDVPHSYSLGWSRYLTEAVHDQDSMFQKSN